MIYTDYYESDEFSRAFNDVISLDKSGVDPYYNLDSTHNLKYKLDKKGYLFFIVGKYATNIFRDDLNYLDKNTYILSYSVDGPIKYLNTILGNVRFSLCVNDVRDAYIKSNDRRIFDVLCDVYVGKYATRCHEIASMLGVNYKYITTAFINSPLENYKFLHSFVENDDNVLDFAKNVKMSKEEYYDLVKPDIVSKINGDRLVDDIMFVSHNYPPMTPKDFLVRYDQLVLRR